MAIQPQKVLQKLFLPHLKIPLRSINFAFWADELLSHDISSFQFLCISVCLFRQPVRQAVGRPSFACSSLPRPRYPKRWGAQGVLSSIWTQNQHFQQKGKPAFKEFGNDEGIKRGERSLCTWEWGLVGSYTRTVTQIMNPLKRTLECEYFQGREPCIETQTFTSLYVN